MSNDNTKLLKKIRPNRIIVPVVIGLGVVGWMLYNEFDMKAFASINLVWASVFWFFMAFLMMLARDVGYMIRIKILTGGDFTWLQAFRVIMMWEFTSAVTPSAIGGTSLAILYVHKENISVGRSTAVVMATSFLDELYFILFFPLLFIVVSGQDLFTIAGNSSMSGGISFTNEFFYFAAIGYLLKFVYNLFIFYGLFVNPRGVKWLLLQLFRLPLLRKWRHDAARVGTDLIKSSQELRRKSLRFWAKAFLATIFSWTSRYWVVNMLLIAFFGMRYGFADHFLIFARQLVMWIMMLISPTPGGSGFAEFVFSRYLAEFIPIAGTVVAIALMWRLVTYYPYLFIGAFLVPRWIKTKFKRRRAGAPIPAEENY